MVGYAMSASSERSFEDILITFFDSDDFVFVDDCAGKIICRYSRESRNTEVIFSSMNCDDICIKTLIYDIVSLLKKEEFKWNFPLAISWNKPEFGNIETVNVDFQQMWPAVMFLSGKIECACVNITDLLFEGDVRVLHASFAAEILNMIVHFSKMEISNPFYACYNTVFCDLTFAKVVGGYIYDDALLLKCAHPDLKGCKTARFRKSRRCVNKNLADVINNIEPVNDESGIFQNVISIRRKCFYECINVILSVTCSHSADKSDFMCRIRNIFSKALDELLSLTDELLRIYVIDVRSDINYLTFNDILSALAFAGDKLDMKSVIRLSRKKSAVINKCDVPEAVLPDGRLIY